MSQIDGDRPAFPHGTATHYGMSLRDFIAIAAMHGWLSTYVDQAKHPGESGKNSFVASLSYELADAMLEARKAGAQ